MEIVFSVSAGEKIQILQKSDGVSGFLIGSKLGETLVIKDFFNFGLNQNNLFKCFPQMVDSYGDSLLGVYFSKDNFFFDEWFLGSFVLEFKKNIRILSRIEFDRKNVFEKKEIWRG